MTWNEICDAAEDCAYGQYALKVKDQARYEVELLMNKETDNEDEIEAYINKHNIIFDEHGCIKK
jgi:hypothetical protein